MAKSKTVQLTDLRKQYQNLEFYLRWLQRKYAETKDELFFNYGYEVKCKMREINEKIYDLIWQGAELRPIHFPEIDERLMDALGELMQANFAVEPGYHGVTAYWAETDPHSGDVKPSHTCVTNCDDPRPGYYCIEGRVQNLTEWIEKIKAVRV